MARDQVSEVAVTPPLIRMRVSSLSASAPKHGDKQTMPGRIVVCRVGRGGKIQPGPEEILSVCLMEWRGDDDWDEATFLLDIVW